MRIVSNIVFVIALAATGFAANGPLPDTGTYVGNNITITASVWVNGSYATQGGGGEFNATVAGYATNFWCVDDQAYFNPWSTSNGQVGQANITLLNQVPAASLLNEVQYGNVTNNAGPAGTWGNTNFFNGTSTVTLPGTAQARYEMAAYLVSQYPGSPNTIINNGTADAVQQAIWALTNNSTGPLGGSDPINVSNLGSNSTNGYWINQALQFYNKINGPGENALWAQFTSQWAVVSWEVNPDGTLVSLNDRGTPGPESQTFVVEVAPAPEPGFIGVLAIGLTGLFFVVRRRRDPLT